MTAQEPDIIFYQNQKRELNSYPLLTYFEKYPPMPKFVMRRTSNQRGYVATWEIIENKIYLKNIEGILEGDKPFTLQTLFPQSTGPILADWISHDIHLYQGKFLGYEGAFNQVFEETLIFKVKNGIILGSKIIKNKLKNKK